MAREHRISDGKKHRSRKPKIPESEKEPRKTRPMGHEGRRRKADAAAQEVGLGNATVRAYASEMRHSQAEGLV